MNLEKGGLWGKLLEEMRVKGGDFLGEGGGCDKSNLEKRSEN